MIPAQLISIVIVKCLPVPFCQYAHGHNVCTYMYVSQCLGRSSMDTTNLKSFGNSFALCGYIRRYDCLMVLSATPTTSPTSKIGQLYLMLLHWLCCVYLFEFFSDRMLVMPCILQLLPQINTLSC